MWAPKINHNEFISVNFTPEHLTLCAIKKSDAKNTSHPFELGACNSIAFSHDEYDEGRINNPTAIARHITQFVSAVGSKKAPIAFTIAGAYIDQKIICPQDSAPTPPASGTQQTAFDYCYVYPQEGGSPLLYTCAIDRSIIMQYQLMAIAHKLNLKAVSTDSMAIINLQRYMAEKKLLPDFQTTKTQASNPDFNRLIPEETIAHILKIPSSLAMKCTTSQARIALGAITSLIQP